MAKRVPTVGIIGLGFGRAHIPAFQANGAEVVAVCQRDQATARAVADKYAVPAVFERWQDMLAQAHPDIVVIASPPHLHHAIALAAFAGGAHVLCEKPLAMTAAEGRDMVAAADARRAHRDDVLQLALSRGDAALSHHGRGRPRGASVPHRRALARRAVGGGDGAGDLADGPGPGRAWRDG